MSGGLLSSILAGAGISGLPIKPQITNNELVIEISEKDLYELMTKDLTPEQKKCITINVVQGKIVIRVKLF